MSMKLLLSYIAAVGTLVTTITVVDAHGYLKSPRSRNYHASLDKVTWAVPGLPANTPMVEDDPAALNTPGATCGITMTTGHNYDYPQNIYGDPLPPIPQACYAPGSTIELQTLLTAGHDGHFEYKACPIEPGGVATQDCFDSYPLEFMEDVLYGMPKDDVYTDRAYIPWGKWEYTHKYKLPEGLEGDLVLIQWTYVTANTCAVEGYADYPFPPNSGPVNGFDGLNDCGLDGATPQPEMFWNCAEVRILQDCTSEAPTPQPLDTRWYVKNTLCLNDGQHASWDTKYELREDCCANLMWNYEACMGDDLAPTTPPPVPSTPQPIDPFSGGGGNYNYCGLTWADADASCSRACPGGNDSECLPGTRCFGDAESCPQVPSGATAAPIPPPAPVTPYPTRSPNNDPAPEIAEGDSRLIAYLGNWEPCPTLEQLDSYTHIVVAFAKTYTWTEDGNYCDAECTIDSPVPICSTQTGNEIADWQALGKKVILSFGGAGMGGSWKDDTNNCWDYCFGKEDELSNALVAMVNEDGYDGIDIDYEYCYDTENDRHLGCEQMTSSYSDAKAQHFLSEITYLLRTKMDALGPDLELTHAPMDVDLVIDSPYYQILKTHHEHLNFLMPQFYNGITKPTLGFESALPERPSLDQVYSNLANDMFPGQPEKIVFGFCIDDCSVTGSNTNSVEAVGIYQELKTYNNGEFACNGGAFFWVASDDVNGAWSEPLYTEVSQTAGCSSLETPSPTQSSKPSLRPTSSPSKSPVTEQPTGSPVTAPPSKSPSSSPSLRPVTNEPTSSPTTSTPTRSPSSSPSKSPVTASPSVSPTPAPSKAPVTAAPSVSPTPEPSKAPQPESVTVMYSGKYYIDWQVDGGRCVQDCDGEPPCGGKIETWEIGHDTEEGCCATMSYKTYAECTYKPIVPGPSLAPVPQPEADTRFYPGDDSKCVNDGKAPSWQYNLYESQETCCSSHFNWAYDDCMGIVPPPSYDWWINWSLSKCVQDCEANDENGESCGGPPPGNWITLHSSAEACCGAHMSSYTFEECTGLESP